MAESESGHKEGFAHLKTVTESVSMEWAIDDFLIWFVIYTKDCQNRLSLNVVTSLSFSLNNHGICRFQC
jgi:hypothetical protein